MYWIIGASDMFSISTGVDGFCLSNDVFQSHIQIQVIHSCQMHYLLTAPVFLWPPLLFHHRLRPFSSSWRPAFLVLAKTRGAELVDQHIMVENGSGRYYAPTKFSPGDGKDRSTWW